MSLSQTGLWLNFSIVFKNKTTGNNETKTYYLDFETYPNYDGKWEILYESKYNIYSMSYTYSSSQTPINKITFSEELENLDNAYSFLKTTLYKIKYLNFTNAKFNNITNASDLFYLGYLRGFNADNAEFANLTNGYRMFCGNQLETLSLPRALFNNVTNAICMFSAAVDGSNNGVINLPCATFEKVTDALQMFDGQKKHSVNIESATFDVFNNDTMLMFCNVKSLNVPNSATFTSSATVDFTNITDFTSIEKISYWIKDNTNQTQITVKFKESVWVDDLDIDNTHPEIRQRIEGKNWDIYI